MCLRVGAWGESARAMAAVESWRRVAVDVRGGVAEACGYWVVTGSRKNGPRWCLSTWLFR